MRQSTKDAAANVPTHPIPAMQPAFAESLIEATNSNLPPKPKLRFGDARHRRTYLLDGSKEESLYSDPWRYRPGQVYHELWKLMAQISFGVYLLLNGIANSNEQVVNILQGHIDEVDEFLETTLEDVNLAIQDVQERIDYLKLPMNNIKTFETMLEDRTFRLQIVEGNEKIEHVVYRTAKALEATVRDVDEGLRATKDFAVYLGNQQGQAWVQQRPELEDIFEAMKGNAQGWYKAFIDLQDSAAILDTLLTRLTQVVAEMNLRAGEVSRRTRFSVAPFSDPTQRPRVRGSSQTSSPQSSYRRPPAEPQSPQSFSRGSQQSSSPARDTRTLAQHHTPAQPKANKNQETSSGIRGGSKSEHEAEASAAAADEGLYILQPRIYTPQPPEPVPSPTVQDPISPKQEGQPKRTSLRQRLSLKGANPPQSIQVPPRNPLRPPKPRYESGQHQSPQHLSPRTYQGPDSAYGSDVEVRQPVHPIIHPSVDMSPLALPNTIPSPRSDQQYFPVRASPHSPLQQRPWTSGTNRPPIHTGHSRGQPSAMTMSMLSNVTTLSPENKTLKKKRSAFGWLKKAFTLDEEERAAFEARKAQPSPNLYYEARSPRFLDGKRLPEPKEY
ncbi:hypothetical protein F5B20DRAFT_569517 [Whalleya microplaca]|nr:hypothetical protein F5B20DRAFT_569517 [Whalleya microplaca]